MLLTITAMYQWVFDASNPVVVLLGDHERCQVGRVAGGEDDGEQRPDASQKPRRDSSRTVNVDCRSEQHRPDQPECSEQRELVLWKFQFSSSLL